MMWVLMSSLHKPRLWLRMLVDAVIVAPLLAGVYYLTVIDRQPPLIIVSFAPPSRPATVGSEVEVNWELVEQRYCATVRSLRALQSRVDPDWIYVLGEVQPNFDPRAPRPLGRKSTSQAIRIPWGTPFPPGSHKTTVYYAVDMRAACNWLQELLPESWWIKYSLPRVPIEVEREPSRTRAGPLRG